MSTPWYAVNSIGFGSKQGSVTGCTGSTDNVKAAQSEYSGFGTPTTCGGWRRSKSRSKKRRSKKRVGKRSRHNIVKIVKRGSQSGNIATIINPDWNGLIKVRMLSGKHAFPHAKNIKAYKKSQVRKVRHTKAIIKRARNRKSRRVHAGGDGQAYRNCRGYSLMSQDPETSGYGNILDLRPYNSQAQAD